MPKRKTYVIGDVHGMLDLLQELLKKIDYSYDRIRLVFSGDLTDRGPDTSGVVSLVRSLNVPVAYSNHEDFHTRWRAHANIEKNGGPKNPMPRKSDERHKQHDQYTDKDIAWMASLPSVIHLFDETYCVHAGMEPKFGLHQQSRKAIIRCRYVNSSGRMVALEKDKSQPKGSVPWYEMWNGLESFIVGHWVRSLTEPVIERCPGGATVAFIDTGAVFGGRLTAFCPEDMSYVQVQAKKAYKEL